MHKRILFLTLFTFFLLPFAFAGEASGQSRSNRLTRPCAGSTTPATVSIAAGGNITATPCSGGTVTINGVAISSTNSPTVLRSYLASTVTYNNVAVLADTALSVTVAASGIYDIELTIHTTSGVGPNLNVDLSGTATTTNFIGQWVAFQDNDPALTSGQRVTAAGTDFSPAVCAGAFCFYTFKGTVEVDAAGTLLVRGTQSGATAVNTTIIRGSTLTLTKLN